MSNPNHDQRGRFSSGSASAAAGDHLAAMPSDKSKRHVPGHGTVDRSVPVIRPRLSAAARDLIVRNKMIDQTHYPVTTDATVADKTSGLIGSRLTGGEGRLDPRASTLISGGPGKPRVRARADNQTTNAAMSQSSRPSPRTQPSAAQLIGAGVIKGN
jgi:hypothetical protein